MGETTPDPIGARHFRSIGQSYGEPLRQHVNRLRSLRIDLAHQIVRAVDSMMLVLVADPSAGQHGNALPKSARVYMTGTAALAMPWIVPRIQRRLETYEDIESFLLESQILTPESP